MPADPARRRAVFSIGPYLVLQDAYQRWAPGRGTVLHTYADGMCLVATGEVRGEVCQIGFCLDEVDDLGPVFRDSVRKRLAEGPDVIHTVEF